ncbi:MAG TPA: hypothetical protein VFA06_16590 [Actinocrinis sp.]|uniref:AMIN-like domain-containing (lipo)protein n=1 Tax=Actinocrinis sp. TaxID=1920516 RepID=UPI002D40F3A8|nr:hypothetical protein [Actinocrinis sp.]HZU57489.1 hypothetical protein [Actinocrinis sp.]
MKRPLSPFEQELVYAMDEYAQRTVPPGFDASRIIARERQRVRVRISLAAVCVATAAGIASCVAAGVPGNADKGLPVVGNTNTPVAVTGSPTPAASQSVGTLPGATIAASPVTAGSSSASAAPGLYPPIWPTTPTSSPFAGSVPPVPVLKSINAGEVFLGDNSRGEYWVSFEFTGEVPGFKAQYVSRVVHEGSGTALSMPGSAFLQLTFSSAQAHDDSGNPTLNPPATSPIPVRPGQAVPAYVVNGDFEGTVTVTVGLQHVKGFHLSEQTVSATDHIIRLEINL